MSRPSSWYSVHCPQERLIFLPVFRAVLRKLILEIAGRQPAGSMNRRAGSRYGNKLLIRVAAKPAKRIAPSCDAGERMRWRRWEDADEFNYLPLPQR